jgi:hypothetical protein
MSVHGFGPLGTKAVTTRPSIEPDNFGQQTWFADATASGANDGTVVSAGFLNSLVAQLVYICQVGGINPGNNQGYDSALYENILSIIKKTVENPSAVNVSASAHGDITTMNVQAQLEDLRSKIDNLGDNFATDPELQTAIVNLIGSATSAGDTLGELEGQIANITITQGSSI